jgi:propanol-preferring alcohol dehydrogenase
VTLHYQLPEMMNAMVLEAPNRPLVYTQLPIPVPSLRQVLIKVIACGICRTDLHVINGDLNQAKLYTPVEVSDT